MLSLSTGTKNLTLVLFHKGFSVFCTYLLGRKYKNLLCYLLEESHAVFDTHAHIRLIYDDPIEQLRVIQEAKQAQVTRIVSICNSLHDFTRYMET